MIPVISSVSELITALNNIPIEDRYYLDIIMQAIHIPEKEFERFYTWNDKYYTRNCLSKTFNYELLLICWEKGQKSPIHDFNSHEAWIHPISGKLREEEFIVSRVGEGLERVGSVVLGVGDYSYMNDSISIHRYSNIYEMRSVSLNLYARPVERWQVYDEFTGESHGYPVRVDSYIEDGVKVTA